MRGGDNRTASCSAPLILRRGLGAISRWERSGTIVNEALVTLEREFAALYSPIGRPSIAPDKLLRAMVLQAFYSIRSEAALDGAIGIRPSVPLVRRHRR